MQTENHYLVIIMVNRNYTTDFNNNTEVARKAEEITIELLEQLIKGVKFISVHDDEECFHLGDILSSDGKYYDVKDDGVIHRTGNIFAEEMKYWKSGSISDGWMRNGKYDYLCILDMIDHNLYILDFNRFKKMYRKGKFIKTNMGDNITTGYCVPLWRCREDKCLLYEIQYEYDEDFDFYSIKKAV